MTRVQRVRNAEGVVVGYRSQPRHPLTGKQISITGTTEQEVLTRLAELQRLRRDRLAGAQPEEVREAIGRRVVKPQKLAERWREWSAVHSEHSGFAPRRSAWQTRIAPHFGKRVPAELTAPVMAAWQQALRPPKGRYSQKSVVDAYWLLASLVRLAVDSGEIAGLPWGKWRPERAEEAERQQAGTWEDWRALVLAALAYSQESWAKGTYSDVFAVIVVMGLTGLRQAEAAGLGWDCLEIDATETPALMTVRWQARKGWPGRSPDRPRDPPKGRRRRVQVLHPSVVDVLRRQRAELRNRGWYRGDGPVFPVRGGEWRRDAWCIRTKVLREVVARAGLRNPERWVGHSLKHTFCSLEANSAADIKAVMTRAGHRDIRTTLGYVHAGRVLPSSTLPRLDLSDVLPSFDVVDTPRGELPAPAQLKRATGPVVMARRELRARAKKNKAESSRVSFTELAVKWASADRPDGTLPSEVTETERRAYVRAYVAARRAQPDAEKLVWKKAGLRARHATRGAWKKALGRARAALEKDDLPY